MKILSALFVGLLAFALAGCPSKPVRDEGAAGAEAGAAGAEAGGMGAEAVPLGEGAGALGSDPLSDPANPLSKRTIYFDFDSSLVKDEFRDLVIAHGAYLAQNPSQRVRLEGHTDERGTREYNIALGERRARAVEQLLQLQGVTREQIEVVSYGEELPAALGQDEAAWSLNRRVEIQYEGR
jgi:peptidoglycan-associated lipoprotein